MDSTIVMRDYQVRHEAARDAAAAAAAFRGTWTANARDVGTLRWRCHRGDDVRIN